MTAVVARRRTRKPLAAPEPFEAILDRAGENRFAHARPPIAQALWREAVGARIAERARPIDLVGGVLLLRVPSSVWAHELSLLADEVCGRLRERGVDARQLRFRVGQVPAVDRPPERRVSRAVPTALVVPPDVAVALGAVGDPELRAIIERAAAANLAWQTMVAPAPPGGVTEERRAARAPRSAAAGSAPPDPASPASRAVAPGSAAGARDRRR
jgi:hypothetical protein